MLRIESIYLIAASASLLKQVFDLLSDLDQH